MRPFIVGLITIALLLSASDAFGQPSINTTNTYVSGRMMRNISGGFLTLNYSFNAAVTGTDVSLIEWYQTTNPANTPSFAGAVGTTSGSATKIASGLPGAVKNFSLPATSVGTFIYCTITPIDGSGTGATHTEIPWQEPGVGGSTGVLADIFRYAVLAPVATTAVCGAGTNSPFFDAGTSITCSGGTISIDEIGVSDIRFRDHQEPWLILNWGDGSTEEILAELLNPRETAVFFQKWGKKQDVLNGFTGITHVYDANDVPNPLLAADRQCTYTYTMTGIAVKIKATGVTEATCNTSLANTAVVWDTEDNARMGTFDVGRFDGIGTEPAGQPLVLEVCENDDGNFRLTDTSDFNCTPNFETGATSQNNQSRWVQWIYGTVGSDVASVTVNGLTYTSAQFPVYGPIEYLPATVVTPNSITPQMSLPVGTTVGQTLRVTLRSWNICNAYDMLEFDGGFNEDDDGATDISVGTPLTGVTAATSRNADNTWREIVYNVNIIDQPVAPTASASIFCQPVSGSPANNDFNITFSGAAGTYTVYLDAGLTTPLYTDNTAPYEFNPVTQGTSNLIDVNPPPSNPSIYHRYVTVTPANGCESPPLDLVIEIHAPMVAGSIAHPLGATPQIICTGTDPAAFTSVAASGGNGATFNYQWQSSPNGTVWTDIPGETNETFDPPALTTQTYYRRRVRSAAYSILGTCDEAFTSSFRFRIDTPVTGGQIGSDQTICASPGDPANLTNVVSPTGGSVTGVYNFQWESSTDNIAFNTVVGATSSTFDPPAGLAQTTYFRRRVTSGVCSADGADAGTDPDNLAYSANTVTITVHQVIDPGAIGNAQTICASSDPAALTNVTSPSGGDGSNYIFQWQDASAIAGPYTDIGGATASTFDPPVLTATTFYRRRVRSPGPGTICTEQFSNVIEITVNALPTAVISGGGSICQGTPAPPVEIALTGSGPWSLVYSVDGVNQGPVIVNTSPFQIINPAGDGSPDGILYNIVSVSDANTPTCTITAPHANIDNSAAVAVRDIATAPPSVETFTATTAVCDVGGGTNPPDALLNLSPDQVETYRIGYRLHRISTNTTGPIIGPADFTTNAAGELTISPTYAQMGGAPDEQGYQIIIVSIFNVGTGCAGAVPINGPTLIVNPNPSITSHPAATAVCAGGAPSFSVTATIPGGSALSYQWQESTNGGVAWNPITDGTFGGVTYAGATTTSLSITNALIGMHNYQYRVVVGAFAMPCTTTSNPAVLTVNAYPAIALAADHPQDADECVNGSQTFSVTATGPGLTYRWRQSPDGIAPFTDLNNGTFAGVTYSGVTGTTLTLTGITSALNTSHYLVRVTSTGSCSIDSNPAELTVNPLPTSNTINPVLCDFVPGGPLQVPNVDLSVYNTSVTDAPTANVTWYSDVARITVVTTPTITNGQTFYWRATSALTCVNIGQVTFTVEDLPDAVDKSYSFCEDAVNAGVASNIDLTTLEFGAAGVTNGDGTAVTRNVVWFTDAALTTPVDNPATALFNEETDYSITATTTLYAQVINIGSGANPDCYDVADVNLIYKPKPINNPISGDLTLCSGPAVRVYQMNPATNNYGAVHNYEWTVTGSANFEVFEPGNGFTLTNSYTATTTDFLVIVRFPNPGNFVVSAKEIIDGCDGNISTQNVSVTGAPGSLTFLAPASQVCKDQTGVTYSLSGVNASSVYTWTVIGGTVVGASSGVNLGTITVNWGSSTLPQPNVSVTETNSNGCVGAPADIDITLNDVPTITSPNTTTICSGSTPNSIDPFVAEIGGLPCASCTFSWRIVNATANVTIGGLPVPIFPAAGSTGTGPIPSILVNNSGINGTVFYEVTATEGDSPSPPDCGSVTEAFTVTVKPEPVVNTVSNIVVCSQGAIGAIVFGGNAGGETFNWVNDNIAVGLPAGGMGTIGAFIAPYNPTSSAIVANITVTATKNGCTSAGANSKTFTITVNPEPDYVGAAFTRCSDDPLTFDLSTLKNGGLDATSFNITNIVSGPLVAGGGNPSIGTGFGVLEITDDRWINTTNTTHDVTYTIVPVLNGCQGAFMTITVTITPEPVYNDATPTICSDGLVNVDLAALRVGTSVVATAFNITAINNGGLTPGAGNAAIATGYPSTAIQNDTWTNVTSAPVDVEYTIVPDNGGCLGSPFTVTVTVNPEPVYNGSTPSICSDDIVNINFASLKVVSSIAATSFNITNIVDNGLVPAGGNAGIANGVSAAAIVNDRWTNTTAAPEDVEYTVVPLNGTCAGTAFTVVVTVAPEPVYSNSNPTRCSDDLVGIDLATLKNGTGVDATTFNVIAINNGVLVATGGSPAIGNGVLASEISDDRWRNTTNSPASVIYTIVPVTGTCQGTAFTVTVQITPEPVYNNSTGATRCSDENVNINFTSLRVPTSVAATTFNIIGIVDNGLIAGAGNAGAVNGVLANAIVNDQWTNTTAVAEFVEYTVVPVNGTCEGTAFTVMVTINPEPVYNDAAPVICSDDVVNINFATLKVPTSIAATSYNITNIVNNGGLTPAAGNLGIANGLSATAIVNDRWTNTTANPEDIEYTILPLNGTCFGSAFTVTVTVNPEPVYSNASPTRCSDDAVGIDLATLKNGTGVDATTYNITINSNSLSASAGTPINGNGFLAAEIADDRWTNTTNSPVNVIYTIVPVTGTCLGTAFTVTVQINPEPVYNNATPTVCSDDIVNINFNTLRVGTSVVASSFNIINISNPAGLIPAGGNAAIGNGLSASAIMNDRWTNTTASPEDVEYTIVPANGTCQGTAFTVVVTVNPEPVYTDATPTRCSDELVNIDLSTLINGTGVAATGFTITSINANGLTASAGSPASGINLGALVISDDSWTNTTANPVDVTYNITPLSGTCQGTPFTVVVTVNPEPVYASTTVVRCSDDAVNVDLNTLKDINGVTATSFNITTINSNSLTFSAGAPSTGTGFNASEIADDRWTNTSLSPVNVVYTIVPLNGTCLGTPFTVTVTVNPEPVGASTGFIKCNEEQFSINLVSVMSPASVLPSTYNIAVSSGVLTFAGTSNSHGNGKNANELFDDKWINTTPNPEDVTYLITPISASNCAGTPFTLTFTINPKPTAPPITTAQICSDGAFNFDLQSVIDNTIGGGNTVESVFRYTVTSNNAAVSPAGPRNIASDAVINDVYENRSNTNALITYTIIPISDLGCEGSPFEVRLTVFPEPVGISIVDTDCITNLNHNIQTSHINAIGGNSLPSIFTYTVVSSNAGAVPPGPDRVAASNANITDSYVNTSGSDVTITYTITPFNSVNPTCPGTPFTFEVVISSRPVGVDGAVTAVCSDDAFTINPQANITNGVISTFSWTVTYDVGLTGPLSGSGATITGALTNNTTGVKNAYFEVTPTSGTCSGVSYTITQPINPEPVIDPSVTPRTICSDTPTNIIFSALGGSETPTLFDISLISQDPDLTGTPTTGVGLAANAIQNNTYTNNHRTQGLIVQYLVTPYGPAGVGGCQGNDLIVQIEVLPEPVIEPALSAVSICSDVASGIQIETDGISIGATSFFINSVTAQSTATTIAPNTTVASLTSAVSNINADPSVVTGARSKTFIQNDKFTVTVADAINGNNTVVYNVTPRSAAGCFGNAANINLLVLPEPQFDPVAPPPVCSDQPIDLQLLQRDPTSTLIARYDVTGITFQSGLLPGGSNILIGSVLTADGNGDFIDVNDVYTNPSAASLQATYAVKPVAVAALGHSCEGDVVNAVVTIRPSPLVLTNLDKIVCNDAVTGITIGTEVTSAPAASYQITRAALPVGLSAGVFAPGTQIVNGATTTNISTDHVINSTDNPLNITYTIRANTDPSGGGCYGPAETILVTVEPQIIATLTGAPGNTNNAKPNICSADDTEITLVSPSNPSAGNVTFSFTAVAAVPGTVTGMSPGSNLNENDVIEHILTNSSNNPVDVTYTVTPRANSAAGGNGCIGTPATTVVLVEPKPRMTATPASLTVCEGVPLGIDFATVTVPSTSAASMFFTLTWVEDPNTSGAPVNVSGFSTTLPQNYAVGADRLNDILTNTATEQKLIRYSFTPSFPIPSATCLGDPVSINITVSPRPVMVPFTVDPKCSGESFSVDFSSSVTEADLSSTLASWTFSYTPSGDPDLTGASNGAGFDLSQVVFNKNTDAAIVTYAIKARSFGCESNTIDVPVEITPTPKITGVASSVNVCNEGDINVPLSSNATNTVYTWIVDDESQPTLSGASDQTTPVGGPINYTLTNSSTGLSNYTFEITPELATSLAGKVCVGDPFTMVANVAPPLDGRITTSNGTNESFLCAGSREFIFLEFDGLPLFDVVYREGSNTITLENQGAFKPIQVQPSATTEYELISVTDAFGCSINVNDVATVNVSSTDATFAIVGDVEACSPHKVSFQYDQQAGVNYTWKWFDGPDSTTYTAATNEFDKIIKHTFENPSPVGTAKYKVYLETSLADARFPGCLKTTFQEVRVLPTIALGVFADLTTICSGQTVAFTNTSQGVTSHRWFYRPAGTTQENDVRTTVNPAYQLVNNTTQNPTVLEVVYQANNGGCPATTIVPITVYRGVTASFNEGTIPPFQGGSATVTFTNTSTPLDPAFRYEWTFGSNANPEDFTGMNATIPVSYNLPGLKEVVLVATNIQAESDGLTCSSRTARTIEILLPPLVAAFRVNPLASCFPVTIEVTENTSTGDQFRWQVIDQSGNIAATALTALPQFRIVNPGTYDIFLESSSSITGQTAFSQINGVEVFDLPLASLEARPTTLFVPDTELITFNFSTGANFYEWNFDDGTISEDFEPTHFYQLEGTYNITLVAGFDHGDRDIDGDGLMDGNVVCYDTATRQVIAREGGLTKVPNAFTPNKNGSNGGVAGSGTFNDVFLPITRGVANEDGAFIMQIFDRWGTLIFESRNQKIGWDGYDRRGNLVPAGVYVYKLDLRLADGQRTTQVGDVTVIR